MTKEQAETKLKAANLRVLATSQRKMAAAHMRQASHPIYPGQEVICWGKADMINALADQNEARADLLEAQNEATA